MVNESVKWILNRFDTLFVRSVMPQSIFLVQFLLFSWGCGTLDESLHWIMCLGVIFSEHKFYYTFVFLLLLVGFGYIFSILQQLLDNILKGDFSKTNNEEIDILRKKVIEKLKRNLVDFEGRISIDLNDYLLYQVLKSSKLDLKVNTGPYNDQVKIIYMAGIGLAINIAIFGFKISDSYGAYLFAAFLIPLVLYITVQIARSRYRARNIRLYTDFLLDKKKENTQTQKDSE